jgi:DNA-binding NtrC family response regulator
VPVGAEAPISVDARIIAATHRDLPQLVRDGKFREDLYYRLHVVSLTLPPLRSRRQDLPLLIDDLLRRLAERHDRGPVAVDPEAQALLLAYDWPGNVRELHNVLERALVLASQDVIGPEHLPAEIRQQEASRARDAVAKEEDPAALLPLADVERHHVLRVLRAMDGSRERTARVLGISRRTLTRMLQRWRPDLPAE